MTTKKRPPDPPPRPPTRGYRLREFCAAEQIHRTTAWRWIEKGLLEVSRLAPRTGVRVRYTQDDEP